MTSSRAPARARAFPILFAGIALVYLYFIPYFPKLNNPNENSRVYQIRAAVELHKLSVNEQIDRYGPVNDLARRGSLLYAGKAPGTTFIGAPIYAALRAADGALGRPEVSSFRLLYALRLAGALLPTLAFIAAFRRFLGRFVREAAVADAITTVLALGSMMLPYALIYVNHSTSAAAAFGAVMAVEAGARRLVDDGPGARSARQRAALAWLALAGFLIAMGSALDYALFPASLALLIYAAFAVRRRWLVGLAALGAGALGPSLATAWYHSVCWGGPFKVSASFLANPTFAANQSRGLFGIVGMTWASTRGVLWGSEKGLLYFSPIFALAIVGALVACFRAELRRERPILVVCAVIILGMIVYAASLVNWDGGWTIGPRYMTVIVPFAVFGMGLAWSASSARVKLALLPIGAGLGVASVVMITASSVLFPHLPPDYKNPVFEIIWPLWRDAITPTSLGRAAFGLAGRADQAPFLAALLAILLHLVWVGSGAPLELAPLDPAPSRARRAASAALTVLVACGFLWMASIPRTNQPRLLEAGTTWIRDGIWEPMPAPSERPRR